METRILMAAALLPAIALLYYIYKKDKYEKEPIGLLAGLIGMGALMCIPVMVVETLMIYILGVAFGSYYTIVGDEAVWSSTASHISYMLLLNFIGIALVEEGFKWLALLLITKKNKKYNSYFDGLVYAVYVSLGFAALENVLYVFSNGLGTALLRAVTAIPGHMCFGVLMGWFYSEWHVLKMAKDAENQLIIQGKTSGGSKRFSTGGTMFLSIAVPVVAHGAYDFICTFDFDYSIVVFFAFIILLFIFCFKKISSMSKKDNNDGFLAFEMVKEKYPDVVIGEMVRDYRIDPPAQAKPANNYGTPYQNGWQSGQYAPYQNGWQGGQTAPYQNGWQGGRSATNANGWIIPNNSKADNGEPIINDFTEKSDARSDRIDRYGNSDNKS